MHRNTPDVGEVDAQPELTTSQRQELRAGLASIAARTREFLPDEYVVGAEIGRDHNGTRATVAVRPPIGNPVSAGFTPEFGEEGRDVVPAEERHEVARGLAASAALQVKQAFQNRSDDPVAR